MKAYEDNKYEAWKESTYQILHSLLKRSLLINTHVPVVNHANLNLADVAKAKYLEVARRMKAYEDNKYEAWKESTDQILHSLLKRSLLINTHVPAVNHANLNLADVSDREPQLVHHVPSDGSLRSPSFGQGASLRSAQITIPVLVHVDREID
ncbi:uncharacterized protein LOC135067977 isoform X4 [Pseudophryne corroboree]|uniref:uncharacterized protein LOC135067977 isoform X4 n=1 Tax=Pseudophryne corroboree TaxID=495146 RepID=UPI003081F787